MKKKIYYITEQFIYVANTDDLAERGNGMVHFYGDVHKNAQYLNKSTMSEEFIGWRIKTNVEICLPENTPAIHL